MHKQPQLLSVIAHHSVYKQTPISFRVVSWPVDYEKTSNHYIFTTNPQER